MKFSQLIEHKMRNIFLQKLYTKRGGEASPRSSYEKSKLNKPLDQQSEMLYSLFLLNVQVKVHQNILKLKYWLLAFILKLFKKTKRGMKLVSLLHFLHDLWRKIFRKCIYKYFKNISKYFLNWSNGIAWLLLLLKILGNMCTVIICCPVCDIINFEISDSFLIKPFF